MEEEESALLLCDGCVLVHWAAAAAVERCVGVFVCVHSEDRSLLLGFDLSNVVT